MTDVYKDAFHDFIVAFKRNEMRIEYADHVQEAHEKFMREHNQVTDDMWKKGLGPSWIPYPECTTPAADTKEEGQK